MNGLRIASVHGAPLIALGLIVGAAMADSTLWLSSSGGLFTDVTKWSNGMPNSADDLASFNAGGVTTYTITFPAGNFPPGPTNYLTGTTAIGANRVTFVPVTGPTLGEVIYTNTAILIGAPAATPASLTTSIQELVTTSAQLGVGAGSPGTLNVNGGTFKVVGNSADYDLIVGGDARGTITVNSVMNLTGTQGNAVLGKLAGVTGTVNVDGNGATWTNATGNPNSPLAVGGFGTGFLNITLGGKVDDFDAIIGRETGSIGTVTVNGAGSTWTNRGTARVGGGGAGQLQVAFGGTVINNNLIVGGAAGGTMAITNGGRVFDTTSAVGETPPNGHGIVDVVGPGSRWTQTTDLRLGSQFSSGGDTASGTLRISDGGEVVTGRNAFVGSVGSGTVTVAGSGSSWSVGGEMIVADDSQVIVEAGAVLTNNIAIVQGAVSVDEVGGAVWNVNDYLVVAGPPSFGSASVGIASLGDAAHLNSRVAFVGANGGSGQVFVNGAGTIWSNPEDLFVGFDRKGEVFVTEGAQINSGPVQLGSAPFGAGFVTVDGSNWTSDAEFKVGIAGTALLTVMGGGAVSAEEVIVGPRGTIQGTSHVAANVLNGGTIAPGSPDPAIQGSSLGTLFIDGDYEQTSAGRLNIQLSSLSIFDKLVIDGHAVLDGNLNGSLLDGFMPAVGSEFQILTATGGIEGAFDLSFTAIGPISGGPTWILDYSNTDVVLRRIMPPTGDYNRNGTVDAADYTVWRNSFNQTGLALAADGNGDGQITRLDFDVWKLHYGESFGSGAGAISPANQAEVPEPTSLFFLFIGAAACFAKRIGRDIFAQR